MSTADLLSGTSDDRNDCSDERRDSACLLIEDCDVKMARVRCCKDGMNPDVVEKVV